jgi:hypothetical protein
MSSPSVQVKEIQLVKYGRRAVGSRTASARGETQIATTAINYALPHPPRAPNWAPVRKTPAIGRW